jgi:hypothetical protein
MLNLEQLHLVEDVLAWTYHKQKVEDLSFEQYREIIEQARKFEREH